MAVFGGRDDVPPPKIAPSPGVGDLPWVKYCRLLFPLERETRFAVAGTLFEHAEARLSDSEARKALCFLIMWALVRDAVGHAPTAHDYCTWWSISRGSYSRNLQRFQDGFGLSPEELVNRLDSTHPGWHRDGVAGLGRRPVLGLNLDPRGGDFWRVNGSGQRDKSRVEERPTRPSGP